MEAGAASLNIERFCLHDFLDETIEPLEIADAGHAHDIMLHVDSDIWMEGDQDRCASCSPISSRTRSSIPRTAPAC